MPHTASPDPERSSALRDGIRDAIPFILVIIPFGVVFGVVASEAGFDLAQIMGFSILVIAGASQIVAVQLMTENAPALVVLATSLAVNLRMAMYSASLAPYMGHIAWWKRGIMSYLMVDQVYAAAILRYETQPNMTTSARFAYYIGVALPVVPLWYLATLAGAVLGTSIPADLPIDFAVPITFLALIIPLLRSLAHVAAAMASVLGVLAFSGLPFNLGLLVAALLAMVVGAEVERRVNLAKARAQ